jgi:cyclopropane fatty-acyl-phospholipid synthase-like methyltransferase
MKPATTEDIFEILDGSFTSAAFGAAIELGLFWLLAENPLPTSDIARSLNIPLNRCAILLQMLCRMGLLEETACGYAPSALARRTILEAYSRETWAFLAREARFRLPAILDLPLNISKPVSTWEAQSLRAPYYFKEIVEAPDYAARFTRMLYELHISMAEQLAELLDLTEVKRLLDLGGGSGVVTFALLRRQPELVALLLDVENVCKTGREIAAENGLEQRITYLAADFVKDELPTGYDMVMLCDTAASSEALFRKIHAALNPNGRFVLVEQFAPNQDHVVPSHQVWTFLSSLEFSKSAINYTTGQAVKAQLQQSGFRKVSITPLHSEDDLRWNADWVVLEALR